MKIYEDFDLESFETWSGATDTKESIINAGKAAEFNALCDDIFPDGCTNTQMNDFLWFDTSYIYDLLGLDEDGNEPDEEETADPADFEDFQDFCDHFPTCDGCQFCDNAGGDCEDRFLLTKAKGAQ